MEIPFYDNEPSSSEEENIQLLTTGASNAGFDSLDEDRLSSWTVDDDIYEDNDPPDSSTSVRKKIRENLNISGEDEKLYGYIKRPKISSDNENRLHAVTDHIDDIRNPYLNNISDYQNIVKPNCVYIDSNDPNIIFAAELPSANNGVVYHSRYHASEEDDDKRIQTRVILNPPFHSSVAREFLLVQGGLTQFEIDHFHKPVFPNREFSLRCELAKPQTAKKNVLVHAVRSISDLSSSTDHLILIEYVEPQPPVFLNQGMGAFIINWINPQHPGIEYPKPVEGDNRILSQNEKMPLMGMLKKGESMLSLCTSLYNTPLFKHDLPSTDYLLTFTLENPREPSPPVSRVYSAKIRKVDNLFIAGKMEPIARVFQPYDDAYNETTTSFENYLLQQYFKKMNERLSREQLYCLFPYLKKDGQLTDFHERHKQMFTVTDHIYRSRNNLPVSIPRYLTPESVCLLQSCMVSHYLLEKAGIHNIYSFSNTSGTQYLRDKENIKIIYDEIHNRCLAMRDKAQSGLADSISEENCSYKLAYASYQRMESIIYREKMASEFFVERIYRTTWNLTHHYINSIIEGKDRLELTTSNYFTDVLFPDAFGEDYIFLCNKTLRNRKGTTSGKGDEDNGEEGGGKTKNSSDLRQIRKPELIAKAIKLGKSREEAESMKRWPLVQFIARNSYNENPDLYRDQKYNQQQLNQEFMERIQCLFNEQRDKLMKTDVEPVMSSGPGLAVNSQHTNYNQLPSLDHPDYVMGGFGSDIRESTSIQRPIGVTGNYYKPNKNNNNSSSSNTGIVSSRGIPLLVRHLEVRVNGKGVAEVTGNYTRSQRDVNNTLDMEKRLFARPVPLEAILRQYSRFDKKAIPVVKKKIQTSSNQKSTTKRASSKPKKSKAHNPANMVTEETNPRILKNLLQKILNVLESKDVNKCFVQLPVPNTPWAEDYYKRIPIIIDFTILEQRVCSFGYTHVELERDIQQLYENTRNFNGEDNDFTKLAKEFVVEVKQYIEKNRDAFYKAEAQLQPQQEVPVDIGPNPYENYDYFNVC